MHGETMKKKCIRIFHVTHVHFLDSNFTKKINIYLAQGGLRNSLLTGHEAVSHKEPCRIQLHTG